MVSASPLAALAVALEIRFVCLVNVVRKRKNAAMCAAHQAIAWMVYAVQQARNVAMNVVQMEKLLE